MTQEQRDYVQKIIDYKFKNKNLLIQAFTRSTYASENPKFKDNEHLEFLGDSVLNNSVTRKIIGEHCQYTKNKQLCFDVKVDKLSKQRNQKICNEYLAKCITELGFENFFSMGNGDLKNSIKQKTNVKGDLFEAIIGAVAIDSGFNLGEIDRVCERLLNPSKARQHKQIDNVLSSMRNFLPTVYEDQAIQQLTMLHKKFPNYVTKPKFVPKERHDKGGRPYWIYTYEISGKKESGGGYNKKLAQKRTCFKILVTLLGYGFPKNYDDGLNVALS